MPIIGKELRPLQENDVKLAEFIKNQYSRVDELFGSSKLAPLILGYYLQKPWSDEQLFDLISKFYKQNYGNYQGVEVGDIFSLLNNLGTIGKEKIDKLKEWKPESKENEVILLKKTGASAKGVKRH